MIDTLEDCPCGGTASLKHHGPDYWDNDDLDENDLPLVTPPLDAWEVRCSDCQRSCVEPSQALAIHYWNLNARKDRKLKKGES